MKRAIVPDFLSLFDLQQAPIAPEPPIEREPIVEPESVPEPPIEAAAATEGNLSRIDIIETLSSVLGYNPGRFALYREQAAVNGLHDEWAIAVSKQVRGAGTFEQCDSARLAYYAARSRYYENVRIFESNKTQAASDNGIVNVVS